ncbi:MAG: TlpA disulfide reductase family protein [Bacillota bacterium]|nr:TlpA disulfide reductase family protein [Bacillota bacterium]
MKIKPFLCIAAVFLLVAALYALVNYNNNWGKSSNSEKFNVLSTSNAQNSPSIPPSQFSGDSMPHVEPPLHEESPLRAVTPTTQNTPSIKAFSTKPKESYVIEGTNPGNRAINFTLTNLNGKKVSLSDFKGKNVFLNFFASWCSTCRKEMPDMERFCRGYKDKNLIVLAVGLGENVETMKSLMSEKLYTFNVLLDTDFSVSNKYCITTMPVSYFINKEGIIVKSNVGGLDRNTMKKFIEALYKL